MQVNFYNATKLAIESCMIYSIHAMQYIVHYKLHYKQYSKSLNVISNLYGFSISTESIFF